MPTLRQSLLLAASVAIANLAGCGDGEPLDVGLVQAGRGGTNDHPAGDGGTEAGRDQSDGGTDSGAAAGADSGNQGGTGGKGGAGGKGSGSGTGGGDGGDEGQAASGDSGGAPSSGGTGALGGSSGDTSLAGAGGAPPEPDPTAVDVCLQFENSTESSFDLTLAFEKKVIADCRVNWVTSLYYDSSQGLNDRSDFLNQLLHFSLHLWACPGYAPPDSFDLIYAPAPLSGADVGALVDAYIAAVSDVAAAEEVPFTLTDAEVSDLRTVLENLSEPLLIEPDPGDFTDPRCTSGASGSGGGSGASGSGGGSGASGGSGTGGASGAGGASGVSGASGGSGASGEGGGDGSGNAGQAGAA